jgi:ribose transport system permease protein
MPADASGRGRRLIKLRKVASIRNLGAVYVWIAVIVLFTLLEPNTFPTAQTTKAILNEYSITALAALSLVVPLAAGYYDLSIGATIGLAGLLVAYLLQHTSMSPVFAGLITLAMCAGIGLVNAFVVVALKVDSFIGTLGSGALIGSATLAISKEQPITGRVGGSYASIATHEIAGVQLPVLYMIVVMLLLGFWLERTRSGRHLYATGYAREASRLVGIGVNRLGVVSLVTSSVIAGFAGMVLAARVASASPEAGPSYLIPAFAGAFLGATQLRGGRFNPFGTVIAVLLLGTGTVGLLLVGGPTWTARLFEGTVLITAVALSRASSGARRRLSWRRLIGAGRRSESAEVGESGAHAIDS